MSSFQYSQIDWAGVVVALPNGTYFRYQILHPEGSVLLEYQYDRDIGLWGPPTRPSFKRTVMKLDLSGEVMAWRAWQRSPHRATGPLAIPPTPGYTEDSSTRPAIGR